MQGQKSEVRQVSGYGEQEDKVVWKVPCLRGWDTVGNVVVVKGEVADVGMTGMFVLRMDMGVVGKMGDLEGVVGDSGFSSGCRGIEVGLS